MMLLTFTRTTECNVCPLYLETNVCNAGGIFAPFIPGDLEELKVKELKNGRQASPTIPPTSTCSFTHVHSHD